MLSFRSNLFYCLFLSSFNLSSFIYLFFFLPYTRTPSGVSAVSPTVFRVYTAFTLTCKMRWLAIQLHRSKCPWRNNCLLQHTGIFVLSWISVGESRIIIHDHVSRYLTYLYIIYNTDPLYFWIREEKALDIEVNNSDTYFIWVWKVTFKNTSSMFMAMVYSKSL